MKQTTDFCEDCAGYLRPDEGILHTRNGQPLLLCYHCAALCIDEITENLHTARKTGDLI